MDDHGFDVGDVVGIEVGTAVGAAKGNSVGTTVGAGVGRGVNASAVIGDNMAVPASTQLSISTVQSPATHMFRILN